MKIGGQNRGSFPCLLQAAAKADLSALGLRPVRDAPALRKKAKHNTALRVFETSLESDPVGAQGLIAFLPETEIVNAMELALQRRVLRDPGKLRTWLGQLPEGPLKSAAAAVIRKKDHSKKPRH